MKIIAALLLVSLSMVVSGQVPTRSEDEILKVISANTSNDITSVDFFQNAPADKAWEAFNFLIHHVDRGEQIEKKVGLALAENPEVEKYVTEGIDKLPYSVFNGTERSYFLWPLSHVPAPWSVRLLAKYAMDRRIPADVEDGSAETGWERNSSIAVVALGEMGFSDAPPSSPNGATDEYEKAWVEWWKANENRIDQRIREINSGYYPPKEEVTAGSPKSPLSSFSSHPKGTPNSTRTPVSITTADTKMERSFPVVAAILLFGLVAGLGVFFLRRK